MGQQRGLSQAHEPGAGREPFERLLPLSPKLGLQGRPGWRGLYARLRHEAADRARQTGLPGAPRVRFPAAAPQRAVLSVRQFPRAARAVLRAVERRARPVRGRAASGQLQGCAPGRRSQGLAAEARGDTRRGPHHREGLANAHCAVLGPGHAGGPQRRAHPEDAGRPGPGGQHDRRVHQRPWRHGRFPRPTVQVGAVRGVGAGAFPAACAGHGTTAACRPGAGQPHRPGAHAAGPARRTAARASGQKPDAGGPPGRAGAGGRHRRKGRVPDALLLADHRDARRLETGVLSGGRQSVVQPQGGSAREEQPVPGGRAARTRSPGSSVACADGRNAWTTPWSCRGPVAPQAQGPWRAALAPRRREAHWQIGVPRPASGPGRRRRIGGPGPWSRE